MPEKINLSITRRDTTKTPLLYAAFFLYAFVIMLFCTKSSPLFLLNDWYDANVYYTVGKGWAHSITPYLSLEDNKGPLLYLLYMFAYLFDRGGVTGVYAIQSLFLGVSVVFAYKSAGCFIEGTAFRVVAALFSALFLLDRRIYAPGLDMGGGGPDELCRALIFVGFYLFLLYFHDKKRYKTGHTFAQGCLVAAVLMMKFTIAVFWAGFLIVILCGLIREKRFGYLFKQIGAFTAGILAVTLPFCVYFGVKGALGSFLHSYFYVNAVYSAQSGLNPILALPYGLVQCAYLLYQNTPLLFSVAAGLVYVAVCVKGPLRTAYLWSFGVTSVLLFTGKVHAYTVHPYTFFAFMGVAAAVSGAEKLIKKRDLSAARRRVLLSLTVVSLALTTAFSNGLVECSLFKYAWVKETPVQLQVAELIKSGGEGNPTLLEVGSLDSGFYTATGILPTEKYFYVPNIPYDDYPDPLDSQLARIAAGDTDYIVVTYTFGRPLSANEPDIEEGSIEWKITDALLQNYEEIGSFQKTVYRRDLHYHVFRARESKHDTFSFSEKRKYQRENASNTVLSRLLCSII